MFKIALSLLLSGLTVELFLRLPLRARLHTLSRTSRRAIRVLLSPAISEHWKEKALLCYARNLAISTGLLALTIGAVAVVLFATLAAADAIVDEAPGVLAFVTSYQGLILITIFSSVYAFLRVRLA